MIFQELETHSCRGHKVMISATPPTVNFPVFAAGGPIWATEYLTHPKTHGDFLTAAIMLGDHPQTVIKSYSHLFEKHHHDKAADFLNRVITPTVPPPGDEAPAAD